MPREAESSLCINRNMSGRNRSGFVLSLNVVCGCFKISCYCGRGIA